MTSREIRKLARKVAVFDPDEQKRRMRLGDERCVCVSCRVEFSIEPGLEPSAVCDSCANSLVYTFAVEITRCLK
jgi:hypothetical protein